MQPVDAVISRSINHRCNFDRLKALQEPLPAIFPAEYKGMWAAVGKIIDGLHLSNHKMESCKSNYNPELFSSVHPNVKHADTMAAEQQFSWLGKFKKQINSMTKPNQLFFLHRIIVRHNAYNASALRNGQKTLNLPVRTPRQRAGF